MRTLQPGSVEYVWTTITAAPGNDLTDVTVHLATSPHGSPPGPWVTPAEVEHLSPTKLRAALLVTATTPGKFSLWARLDQSPEHPVLYCGFYTIRNVTSPTG